MRERLIEKIDDRQNAVVLVGQ